MRAHTQALFECFEIRLKRRAKLKDKPSGLLQDLFDLNFLISIRWYPQASELGPLPEHVEEGNEMMA